MVDMDDPATSQTVQTYLDGLDRKEVVAVRGGKLVRSTGHGWEEVMPVEPGHRPNYNRLTRHWSWEPVHVATGGSSSDP